jgi:hypothetical protein
MVCSLYQFKLFLFVCGTEGDLCADLDHLSQQLSERVLEVHNRVHLRKRRKVRPYLSLLFCRSPLSLLLLSLLCFSFSNSFFSFSLSLSFTLRLLSFLVSAFLLSLLSLHLLLPSLFFSLSLCLSFFSPSLSLYRRFEMRELLIEQ